MVETNENGKSGLRLRWLNAVMMILTVLITLLLFFSVYSTIDSYRSMRSSTEDYIKWQHSAYDMQRASDYLTEQARCFAVTGDIEHLLNYFNEADVTCRREKALSALKDGFDGTEVYSRLENAMAQSVKLMVREYYSMRLTVSALGYPLSEVPAAVQQVALTKRDAALSPDKQLELARSMVFDAEYFRQKSAINDSMESCLQALVEDTDLRQRETADRLHDMLFIQQVLISAMLIIVLSMVILTSALIIRPLMSAVSHVREDRKLPVNGSYEFRFLANTYNKMYNTNRAHKEQLIYENMHDPLTDLYNRRAYDIFMESTQRVGSTLLLIDIDKFKSINDTYGHDEGDRVLRSVSSVLKSNFRSEDYICRIGGDEFAVIMLHAGQDVASLITDKIRVINRRLASPPSGVRAVSISAGIAFGSDGLSADVFFKNADTALYEAKNDPDRDCVFHSEKAPE